MSPLAWCHQCDVGETAVWCWLCGAAMSRERPWWITGKQVTPGECAMAQHPEGRLLTEVA